MKKNIIRAFVLCFLFAGIAKAKDQSFEDLYAERNELYKKYADITIECSSINQEEVAEIIANEIKNLKM